ncbi:tRNA (cytidine(34)-2'-O)-methyltransferase [Nitrospirillum amazonense]|uniref:tRNA (cytidine(34)-2'-O)-methyltransferase n=1 Tax=Nitrospirillum amazonense TaxID=28077 RepID=UPI00241266A1|nr:tRNA (cytidine(34)-2'-O)-methyltransferase [Nitrospirillum amazonense]MDG3442119.1 tRNA (cytidine(34)-2'-O)-methyltransferase [Nitrospirillum amazonense]
MRIALYQPDIPQNAGTLMRLGACLNVGIDIIEPCGFVLDDKRLRRSGMDYLEGVDLVRHTSWTAFETRRRANGQSQGDAGQPSPGRGGSVPRLLLLTTRAALCYTDFVFQPDDILLLGRESAGVPEEVHTAADARLAIPLRPGLRSLNVAMAAAMVVGEAIRQLDAWPR